jgi:hypothetical protein
MAETRCRGAKLEGLLHSEIKTPAGVPACATGTIGTPSETLNVASETPFDRHVRNSFARFRQNLPGEGTEVSRAGMAEC